MYGKINPEESHVVLLYIPQYVRDGIKSGEIELPHIREEREKRLKTVNDILDKILDT